MTKDKQAPVKNPVGPPTLIDVPMVRRYDVPMIRRSVQMPALMWTTAEEVGGGNASAGIRQLIEWANPEWMG